MTTVSEDQLNAIGSLLIDEKQPLKARFRALFTLKNLGGDAAVDLISKGFKDKSALLKHELAYCLGQMKNSNAISILSKVLEDKSQEPMVRHEAGEALGAIGDAAALEILEKFVDDPVSEVSETCRLAQDRLMWLNTQDSNDSAHSHRNFPSIDPAPPFKSVDIEDLKQKLTDESLDLFHRYRAMFALRNINTDESAKAIAEGFMGSSALFRHEIAFVLGQMASSAVTKELEEVVRNQKENEMVRHEAAEALGAIGTIEAMDILKEYQLDQSQVVRESCEIALDMCDYSNNTEFQYADGLVKVQKC